MKKTFGTIIVEVSTVCPICGYRVDVADSFYGIDEPIDPFDIRNNGGEHTVLCPECENEFIIEELEF